MTRGHSWKDSEGNAPLNHKDVCATDVQVLTKVGLHDVFCRCLALGRSAPPLPAKPNNEDPKGTSYDALRVEGDSAICAKESRSPRRRAKCSGHKWVDVVWLSVLNWPTSATWGRNQHHFGRRQPKFGRHRPSVWPKSAPNLVNIGMCVGQAAQRGRGRPNMWSTSAKCGRHRPNMWGPSRPHLDRSPS